jgi:coenzyme F420-reducing hydrogenase alpha subunit
MFAMSQAFDPGSVVLRLTIVDGRVAATEVTSVRPDVTRLLRGRSADQAVALVPLIYSLCGKAQGIAARAALAAARDVGVAAHVDADALNEAAREHAWQLLVNWPRQLGLDADEPFFVRLARAPVAADRGGLADELCAHRGLAALRDRLTAAGDTLLLARVHARLDELRDFLAGRPQALGTVVADPVGAGIGSATVTTARGPLVHRLALDAERVADYRITAPTDLHFAAAGPVAAWLTGLHGLPRDQAAARAARAVMAFDPCVPWTCEFR